MTLGSGGLDIRFETLAVPAIMLGAVAALTTIAAVAPNPNQSSESAPAFHFHFPTQFSMSSIVLATTFVCVCFAAARGNAALAIALLAFLSPLVVRISYAIKNGSIARIASAIAVTPRIWVAVAQMTAIAAPLVFALVFIAFIVIATRAGANADQPVETVIAFAATAGIANAAWAIVAIIAIAGRRNLDASNDGPVSTAELEMNQQPAALAGSDSGSPVAQIDRSGG